MVQNNLVVSPCPGDLNLFWATFGGVCLGICISYAVSLVRAYFYHYSRTILSSSPSFSILNRSITGRIIQSILSYYSSYYTYVHQKIFNTKVISLPSTSLPLDTNNHLPPTVSSSSAEANSTSNTDTTDYITRFDASLARIHRSRNSIITHNPFSDVYNSNPSEVSSSSSSTVSVPTDTTNATTSISIVPKTTTTTSSVRKNNQGSRITLVGAGPGSPDLLTLAAYEAIRNAEVVICDKIASQELKSLVPSSSALVLVADKIPGKADLAQTEVNTWGIQALQEGKRVVRLKVGDPFLYGRGGEEVLFYRSYGYEPVILPGVSSALVAPLVANIPVTHRGIANQLLISTGQGQHGVFPDLPVYDANRTIVLLMAIGRIPLLMNDLHKERQYPVNVPIAIIERASQPDQRILRTTLENIQQCSEQYKVTSPAVIVIGNVVNALDNDALVVNTNAGMITGTEIIQQ